MVTKGKRIRSTITTIQDGNGVTRKGHREVTQVTVDYFQGLFSSSPINPSLYDEVFECFQARITNEMNADLTRGVTAEEIQQAMFDIGPH